MHDALFRAPDLEEASLFEIAKGEALDLAQVRLAIGTKRHEALISADVDLAEDVAANGTPHFFINGRRVVGAVPLEDFVTVIEEELTRAQGLVAKGTSPTAVYAELQKSAALANPPTLVDVPAAGPDQPVLGKRDAKVTIVEFADFQCPYCGRADSTIESLLALYPGKIKLVWRHTPLPFHKFAHLASEAAVEAFRQKGDAGILGLSRAALQKSDARWGARTRRARRLRARAEARARALQERARRPPPCGGRRR